MGREEEGKASLGAVLAEPCFSHSLTSRAGQWLEFPMHRVGCYLMKLAIVSRAKESHQADIQHQLKEGKDHCASISQAAKRPLFPQKHKGRGLACPLLPVPSVVIPTWACPAGSPDSPKGGKGTV